MKSTNERIINCPSYITSIIKNQRIDNFLFKKFNNIPKSLIYKKIRTGKIRVNKKRIKPKYKLNKNDIIKIPFFQHQKKNDIKEILNNVNIITKLKKNILFEDKNLIILNKPSGIAVHGGSGIRFGIIEIFRKIYSSLQFLDLVHRLDRNTSGILILSKKNSSLRNLHEQIRNRTIKKKYIALVHGKWNVKHTVVKAPLIKKFLYNGKKIMSVHPKGKVSETRFQVKKQYKNTTLMNIFPITGRTHQIRIHASYAGHPLIFDPDYGDNILDSQLPVTNHVKKILLHANEISFIHPNNKNKITIKAPLEVRFEKYLNLLEDCN
ncbi:Ribosomal large subunit pseudouridine synthase C [Buchnera aphidicola (Thelaxes suberi)]|uniref:RluA family pseudouridine synthase n=1 Tax=Buchnera aphidicola TaxID=9 RepID=UPI003463AA24